MEEKDVGLKVLDQNIDTTSAASFLICLAQFETEIRSERRHQKSAGIKFGRKAKTLPEDVEKIRQERAQGTKRCATHTRSPNPPPPCTRICLMTELLYNLLRAV